MRIAYYLPIGLGEFQALPNAEQHDLRSELDELIDELNELSAPTTIDER